MAHKDHAFSEKAYLPPECDVSIRTGWFWHHDESPKSVAHLLAIYERSVGLGANLLLNIPPDQHGRIDPQDFARLEELRDALEERYSASTALVPALQECAEEKSVFNAMFAKPLLASAIEVNESLEEGQKITAHRIIDEVSGEVIAGGGTTGVKRIHTLEQPRDIQRIRIAVEGKEGSLASLCAYTGSSGVKAELPFGFEAPTEEPDS